MTDAIAVEPSVLTRDYKASRQMVFDAWTQEQHLCKWQVPNAEVKCDYKFADIKAGGSALHKMTMPSGGDILAPRMPNWPQEIRATIKLSEADGVTHMEFIWQPINPTAAEAEAWDASRSQHGKGWGGGFEMLANHLSTL
ncbi:MAG: hypothetical protein ACI9HY_004249 [Planctomycetaceae bacterium]|jgi:uncharacterized protein YndB with AHSA1/START domain